MSRARAALAALVVAATLPVVAIYVVKAAALVAYPWDWSPDEGLALDYARRARASAESLYPRSAVPFPSAYGPLLPYALAPVVELERPLRAARWLALGWTLVGTASLALLLRRRAGPEWALAGAALWLAPLDLSFWHTLVRVDGPMVALWLAAAAVLLPKTLDRGTGALSPARLAAGTALLLAAVLAKPTAILHGAPLVLGWFLVDRRSAWRLSVALGAAGLLSLGLLQIATSGGFLWAAKLWARHPAGPGQALLPLLVFGHAAWPIVALALVALAAAARAGARPLRDGSVLLVAGGLAAVPALGKFGAWWNYLLPLLAALVVATGSWWAVVARRAGRGARAAVVAPFGAAVVALVLASTRVFPLPTATDEATATAFYGFAGEVVARDAGPVLVSRPDLVYFLARQPAEIEGSSFPLLALSGAPGVGRVETRLVRAEYSMVVETWPLPPLRPLAEALEKGYRYVGACSLGWYFGPLLTRVYVRRDLQITLPESQGARCGPTASGRSLTREPTP